MKNPLQMSFNYKLRMRIFYNFSSSILFFSPQCGQKINSLGIKSSEDANDHHKLQ